MWKAGSSACVRSIFTQRFHAAARRVTSAMIEAQIPGSGLLTGAENGLIQGVVSMATVKPFCGDTRLITIVGGEVMMRA